jgi:polysaccharide deacetylase family protein (PEP-CTERM system associated)
MTTPFVTVVVPVRNEEKFLEATLQSLLVQNYPSDRYEIIVADGQSEDGTVAVVERLQVEHSNLRLLFNPRRLSSAARNLGIRLGRGEYILVVDGHCEIRNPDYLRQMVEVFERHGVESVGRPQPLDVTGASAVQRAIALARSSRLGHNPGSFIYSAEGGLVPPQSVAIAYRRDVFERIGYFDELFDACEDVEFNTRLDAAGGKCFFDPRLEIKYHPRASLRGLLTQMLRYGRGRARLLLKHPQTLSVPPLVPAAFLAALAASFALGLIAPPFATLFCVIVLTYAAAIMTAAVLLAARGETPELAPILPAVYTSIHVGAGSGVLAELGPAVVRRGFDRLAKVARRAILPAFVSPRGAAKRADERLAAPHGATVNALTFDIEEYFQVTGFAGQVRPAHWDLYEPRAERSTEQLLEMLAAANVRATFFILGWIARRCPGLVRRIAAAGHEVASHGYWHQLVTTQGPAEFRADVRAAKTVLEDALGRPVVGYRAPSFSITPERDWAFTILVEEGYRFDSSVAAGRRDSCGHLSADGRPFVIDTPAGQLREHPVPAARCLGRGVPIGGGYFRLLPYAVTRWAMRRLNAAGIPACVYLHPWETDPEQPQLRVPLMKGFRHRVNLHRTQPRLEQLLRDFRFSAISAISAPAAASESEMRRAA